MNLLLAVQDQISLQLSQEIFKGKQRYLKKGFNDWVGDLSEPQDQSTWHVLSHRFVKQIAAFYSDSDR